VAIAVTVAQDWMRSSDYSEATTTPGISVTSGDWLVAVGTGYATVDDGSDQTWSIGGSSVTPSAGRYDGSGSGLAVSVACWKATSSTTVTVSLAQSFYGAADPSVKVYKVTGASSSNIVGASGSGKGTADPYNPTLTLTSASSVFLGVGLTTAPGTPAHTAGAVTSSTSTDASGTPIISGHRAFGTATSQYIGYDAAGTPGSLTWLVAQVELMPAGAETHTADASRSTTATLTASATREANAAASRSTTATLTATGTVERFAAAAASTTAALTAAATRETSGAAASTVTATLTATATVSPSAGTHYAEAAVGATVTLTASATVERFADAALTATAALTSTAVRELLAAAALTVTAGLASTATIPGQVPTTPGVMRAVDFATPTMRPATTTLPRIAAIVGADAATMTLLISTTAAPASTGLAVFYGGDSSPEAAGLIAAGTPYLWVTGGTIYYEDGS
jgi:hypothetical protein